MVDALTAHRGPVPAGADQPRPPGRGCRRCWWSRCTRCRCGRRCCWPGSGRTWGVDRRHRPARRAERRPGAGAGGPGAGGGAGPSEAARARRRGAADPAELAGAAGPGRRHLAVRGDPAGHVPARGRVRRDRRGLPGGAARLDAGRRGRSSRRRRRCCSSCCAGWRNPTASRASWRRCGRRCGSSCIAPTPATPRGAGPGRDGGSRWWRGRWWPRSVDPETGTMVGWRIHPGVADTGRADTDPDTAAARRHPHRRRLAGHPARSARPRDRPANQRHRRAGGPLRGPLPAAPPPLDRTRRRRRTGPGAGRVQRGRGGAVLPLLHHRRRRHPRHHPTSCGWAAHGHAP